MCCSSRSTPRSSYSTWPRTWYRSMLARRASPSMRSICWVIQPCRSGTGPLLVVEHFDVVGSLTVAVLLQPLRFQRLVLGRGERLLLDDQRYRRPPVFDEFQLQRTGSRV